MIANNHYTPLSCCMDQPGAWYEFPAALMQRDRLVGWCVSETTARLVIHLYELHGDPVTQTHQLLGRLGRHGRPTGGRLRAAPVRFDVEPAGDVAIPGFGFALKWDGTPIAWLRDETLCDSLANVLNDMIHACRRGRGPSSSATSRRNPSPCRCCGNR